MLKNAPIVSQDQKLTCDSNRSEETQCMGEQVSQNVDRTMIMHIITGQSKMTRASRKTK